MSTIEQAIAIALHVHQGQKDKGGAPYLLHPLRLMLRMENDEERIVAVLHDVLEDSTMDAAALRGYGFSESVVAAVVCLTRQPHESYEHYIERVAAHPYARRIKLADLEDNMDIRRILEPAQRDWLRLARYRQAWERLRGR